MAGNARPRVGGYEIIGEIGSGGMGTVYLARQLSLNRRVALKVLTPSLSSNRTFVERFRREALLAARTDHPNVVRVYDVGEAEGRHYIAMEFVEGVNLSRMLRAGPLGETEALRVLKQVAAGLREAHGKGIVHRDVKPGNIVIDARGNARVLDLGIAREVEGDSRTLTSGGGPLGTPKYMSPEQCTSGHDVDARSDIYSLGATFFEMLAGSPPFDADAPYDIMDAHVRGELPDVRSRCAGVSAGSAWLVRRMMAKSPDGRFQTCGELLAAIARAERGEQPAADGVPGPDHRGPASGMRLLFTGAFLAALFGLATVRGLLPFEGTGIAKELNANQVIRLACGVLFGLAMIGVVRRMRSWCGEICVFLAGSEPGRAKLRAILRKAGQEAALLAAVVLISTAILDAAVDVLTATLAPSWIARGLWVLSMGAVLVVLARLWRAVVVEFMRD